ncbi:hypothetical protein SAMN04487928_110113 [Butyrivibrio proteoclasticus]|uniref:O-Antigen ligase n=1 Tax=Butyrivibrio proteoclasticus TaxID=43305 RepID=A0A1I5TZ22_9FIRM|nr:hypothetical protein [Butyrivibrio proteoclasticus]SFP88151.1 hypothetical protein SAMN04487928_110113 [Butyrivibrio proteoclasticus]
MRTKILKIFSTIHVIMLCSILPLYMEQGYYKLGEAKGRMYMLIGGVFILIASFLVGLTRKSEGVHDILLRSLFLTNLVTMLFSCDIKTSFLGMEGWRIGFLTTAIMILDCYFLTKGLYVDEYVFAAVFITPFLIFIIGSLGRFGIYPIEIYGSNASFLATIGNINWYVGFLSIFVPAGVGLSYLQRPGSNSFYACSLYTVAGLMALLLQGADSGLLVILGTYGLLLFFSLSDRASFHRFLVQIFTFGLSAEIVNLIMLVNSKAYNYEGNVLISLCSNHIGIVIIAASFFLYRLSAFLDEIDFLWKKTLYRRVFCGLVLALAVVCTVVIIDGRIPYNFGNGRLFIWQISLDMFLNLSSWQKIFGVGQDCYFSYAYHNPMWADSLLNVLEGNRLTNAHCELLTILIERGIVGATLYYGFIGYSLKKIIKKEPAAIICSLPIISYLLNSVVSFSTTVSTTFLFMTIGIGLSLKSAQE